MRAREPNCDGGRGEFGARAAVAAALNVHLRQPRPAKSLYFQTLDQALAHVDADGIDPVEGRADHQAERSAVDVSHHRGKLFLAASRVAGKGRAWEGHVLTQNQLGAEQHDVGRGDTQAGQDRNSTRYGRSRLWF